ncbi:MAG: DegT/DnrJ/EryC1/StrS family aminotransferase [Proteobacteria bacterium]|nr:DegT/DnrJ/EryC1/StrS family aminotransferase [Pseudomonadota bacterium]
MTIPFIDLQTQYKKHQTEIQTAINAVLEHGRYIMGPEIDVLESALQEFTGANHAIACGSGTDALLLALMSSGVGPGDAVFTTPYTFFATAEVISLVGATPVFVDVDPITYNLNPECLSASIKQTLSADELTPKGIIAVDLFGQPADYDAINQIAAAHKLFVLQDAAQSFGASYKGSRTCSNTPLAATSFFPPKPLGCYGDGGAVFTDGRKIADTIKSIRIHGQGQDKYDNVRLGLNARMDSIQAAILIEKLKFFESEIEMRHRVATLYTEALQDHVAVPRVADDNTSVWAQYSVTSEHRDQIREALNNKGIPTATYYPIPIHLSTAYAHLGHQVGDFPVSEGLSRTMFSLPMHPYLEQQQIEAICDTISSTVSRLNHG